MFGIRSLTATYQNQTTPCFEGCSDCPHVPGMEHQSPTPPLSKPGSPALTVCGHGLTIPPELTPPSALISERPFEREEEPRPLAVALQHTCNNASPYPQAAEEDHQQYIPIRDIRPHYYETSPPQYFQYPSYQQFPSYVNYQSHPCGPLSPAPTTLSESSATNEYPRTYFWPTQTELHGPFDGHRDETYFTMSPEDEDNDPMCDKPYARLIYDALMQAPGHRMMLRDIYDWFQRHTTKPAESGTNGWQNSIRHNLSMNQAFENDKSNLGNTAGQKPKVNSVWLLTENAIRNGVQSTTRYRKTGSGKRMNTNRIPAPLRQRSGARGGKAARRAAQLRKKEHLYHQKIQPPGSLQYAQTPMYDYEASIYSGPVSSAVFSVIDPATPMPDLSFAGESAYQPHQHTASRTVSAVRKLSDSAPVEDADQVMHDFGYPYTSDLALEEMLRTYQNSIDSNSPS